jgi:hypothetical protein
MMTIMSCHKSGSSPSTDNGNYYLSSVVTWSPGTKIVDSFKYDSSKRMATFQQFEYDSTSGTPSVFSEMIQFTAPGAGSALPPSYVYTEGSQTEQHQLSYDGQGRIVRDTSLSGTGSVTYYSYPNGNIAMTSWFDGNPLTNEIDTMYLSNGNISSLHIWLPNDAGTKDSLQGVANYTYSSLANPAYHAAISSGIGPLLFTLTANGFGGTLDPISQKATSSVSGIGDGLPPNNIPITFVQKTDSKGRLSMLTSALGPSAGFVQYNYY